MKQYESRGDTSDAETADDATLVERFRSGDERAFDAIVLRYQSRLIRMARGILGDEQAALDAAQDAFVQAYGNLRKFRGDSGLYTWLYRILYNSCISIKRHESVIPFVSTDDENVPDIPSGDADPGELCERREFRAAVEAAIVKLPERQGMVFRLRQLEGLAHREIGDLLGITEGASVHGDNGWVVITNKGWKAYDANNKIVKEGGDNEAQSRHVRNFLDAVKSRDRNSLNQEIESGHMSSVLCHAGNIAWRVGKTIAFDPKSHRFDDTDANKYLTRDYRKGYELPRL